MIKLYTLNITLQHHDSYEYSNWYSSYSFNTKCERYNYIERITHLILNIQTVD